MSHLQNLQHLRSQCEAGGDCTQYNAALQREYTQNDRYTANANQTAMNWGITLGLIGLFILIVPFIKPLKRFMRFSLPGLAVITPVIVGIVIGICAGFAITFSACYKQTCGPFEGTAMFTLPAISLVITVPVARKIYQKRQNIANNLDSPNPLPWVVIGCVILLFAFSRTVRVIQNNNSQNQSVKQNLQNTKL